MRTAVIGSLEVSVVGLGCNNFGRAIDEIQSADVVKAALDAGMSYFDTASNYGGGLSESFLGRALGGQREEVVIGTKFGVPVPGWDGSGGASPAYARRALERSLRELDTEYVDLWMVHFPDEDIPIADTLEVMNRAVEEGKVRQLGCSNFDRTQLGEALSASDASRIAPFTCDQVEYSMVHREPDESGLRQLCETSGVALLPFYPLASGLLTGKTRRGAKPAGRLQMDRYQGFLTDENFNIAEGVERFAGDSGLTVVQVALGWLLSRSGVPAVTPGATTAEQVVSNAQASDWIPTSDDLAVLAALVGD